MSEIKNSMEKDVLKEVQKTQLKNIQLYVYDVYDPEQYVRRRQSGGLSDPRNIVGVTGLSGNNARLSVYNLTRFNNSNLFWAINSHSGRLGDYLTPLIVLGDIKHRRSGGSGYIFFNLVSYYHTHSYVGQEYAQPRDFITATKIDLRSSHGHSGALKKSLKSKGLNVQ